MLALARPFVPDLMARYAAAIGDVVPWIVATVTLTVAAVWLTQQRRWALPRWSHWLVLAPLIVAALVRAYGLLWIGDDAFISFRYADNLASGHGLVFNPGERVEGYTNFLWTVLIAGAMRLGASPILTSVVLSLASFAGVLILSTRLLERLRPQPAPLLLPLAAVVVASNYVMASFGTSGLETMFGALLVLLALELVLAGRPLLSGLAGIAATMAHPDHAIFYVSLGAALLLDRQRRRELLRYAVPFAVVYVPYFLWRWSYYGDLFPNTYYAKSADRAYFSQGGRYVLITVFAAGLFGAVPLAAAAAWRRRGELAARYFMIAAPLFTIYVAKIGGDFMLGRLFVPLLPILFVFAECGVRDLLQVTRRRVAILGGGGAALLLVMAAWPIRLIRPGEKAWHVSDERTFYEMSSPSIEGIRSGLARDAINLQRHVLARGVQPLLGAGCVGMMGYITKAPIADTLALTDRTVAHQPIERRTRPGHEKIGGPAYLYSRQVDFSTDPIYPEPYARQALVRVGGTPWTLSRFQPDVMNRIRGPQVRFTDPRVGWDRYDPTRRRVTDDRLACDAWFMEEFYFKHNRDPERRARLLRGFARRDATLRGAEALLLTAVGEQPSFREVKRLRFTDQEGWKASGSAFVDFPSLGQVPDQAYVAGQEGPFANSMARGELDRAQGTLTSAPFTVEGDAMTVLVGGGMDLEGLRVALLVDGQPVRRATGCNSEILGRRVWNVEQFKGRTAVIEVRDASAGGWGHVLADEVVQWVRAEAPAPNGDTNASPPSSAPKPE